MEHRQNHRPNEEWQAEPMQAWQPLPASWQRYAADLHQALLERWIGRLPAGTLVLKTDLFEEAMGKDHPCRRMTALGWRPLGMDVGFAIARGARRSGALAQGLGPIATDVRRLPFADGSLRAIFCNSTLDHFHRVGDIDAALHEMWRALAPDGKLLLTLDNPLHPLVALRNALPRRLTDRLGITDFYVGPTLSLKQARRRLRSVGFEISDCGTFMHAVRFLVLRRLRRIEQRGGDGEAYVQRLLAWERLARRSTAQLTGHFIFVAAQKPR